MKKLLAALAALCLTLAPVALAEPENTATLYVVAYGEEVGQYPLGYSGELTAERLLEGLSALTEHAFACESIEREGEAITLTWSSEASLMPGVDAPMEVESLQLTFYDFDSTLQFMLDSAYHTLVNNLDVQKVFFNTIESAGLHFLNTDGTWALPAGAAYNGSFASWYATGYTFEDTRSPEMMGDPGDNISAEDAAQIAYAYLAYGEGADGWRIILEGFSEADGCEGYAFSIGQGDGDGYAESFGALVTYDGGVYARKAGETEYTLFTNWK